MRGSLGKIMTVLICFIITCCAVLCLKFITYRHNNSIVYKSEWGKGSDEELKKQTYVKILELSSGIRVYNLLHGTIPSDGDVLTQTLSNGGVLLFTHAQNMSDAWGEDISYSVTNALVMLISAGIDKRKDTEDDVRLCVMLMDGTNRIWGLPETWILKKSKQGDKGEKLGK